MRLVVVIPALNEEATITEVVAGIPNDIQGVYVTDVVVVDDGSTDRTAELAEKCGVKLVRHRRTLGLGAAFRTGIEAALSMGAGVIVFLDGDGQHDPADVAELVRPIREGRCDVVTCTRFADGKRPDGMPVIKFCGNLVLCRVVNLLGGQRLTDASCGFRAYSREAAMRLNLYGDHTYVHESLIDAAAKGMTIGEVPLNVLGERLVGRSRVAGNLWWYGIQVSTILLRTMRDWRPLRFFGATAMAFMLIGLACWSRVFGSWLVTGLTSPWRSLITAGGACMAIGIGIGVLALVADQVGRNRRIQEELLYLAKVKKFSMPTGSPLP